VGSLLYLVEPRRHVFKRIEDCPDHLERALPYMLACIVIEAVLNTTLRGQRLNIADSLTSIHSGVLMVLAGLVSRTLMLSTYTWVYQQYRLIDVAWDSVLVWVMAAILIDCGYYWFHRASHEVGLLWAVHQMHHSSEEFNLTTALRQPVLEGLGWLTHWFYLPCALFIPPTQMLVHSELNFLYQFWIHTELVPNLGPLEFVFNTASQHRVHHGANRYCIDKNYGGFLSVWDRIFGTFAKEDQSVDLVYGLVDQPQSFNAVSLNFFYFNLLHEKATSTGSWKAWFYGPGWFPGLPRLGDVSSLPEAPVRSKLYSEVGLSTYLLVLINTIIALLILDIQSSQMVAWYEMVGLTWLAGLTVYIAGLLLDGVRDTLHLQVFRSGCAAVLLIWSGLQIPLSIYRPSSYCLPSLLSSPAKRNRRSKHSVFQREHKVKIIVQFSDYI